MIAGHFGFAAAVKSRTPSVPLWALMFATVWLDVVFVPLYLAGIETLEPAPGAIPGYAGSIIHAVYTHSLTGALLLSAVLGLAAAARWTRSAGVIVGLTAFSHWLLDLIVHRPDLPIFPGNWGGLPQLGLGLWRYPIATMAVEAALLAVGTWMYWRAARQVTLYRRRGWAVAASAAIAICGALTLFLDVTGIAG